MSALSEVLAQHAVAGMSAGTHLACRCNRTWVTASEYTKHLEEEIVDAGFGLVAEDQKAAK